VEASEDIEDPGDGRVAEVFGGGVEGLVGEFCSSEVANVVAAVEAASGAEGDGDLITAMDDFYVRSSPMLAKAIDAERSRLTGEL
jgi:hypothetical protein